MNNLKLITTHPDYWLLVDTETYLCDKTIAYLPKHPSAPVLEGVLQLPELPKQDTNSQLPLNINAMCQQLILEKDPKGDNSKMYNFFYKEGYKTALQPLFPTPTPVGFEPEELEEDDAIVSLALHGHWFKTIDNVLQGRWLYETKD